MKTTALKLTHDVKLKTQKGRQTLSLSKGFTLIELLVVIGILAILLAITLIAINPARQFSQANDTKRRSDVNTILNAVNQYMADNQGTLPATISNDPLAPDTIASDTPAGLCTALVPVYIAALPVDPLTNNGTPITDCAAAPAESTSYEILQSTSDSRITVSAPLAEIATDISVTR